MPKDSRTILSGVRVGKQVFTDGMEDELSAALDQSALDRLTEKGAIAGDFKASKAVKPEAEPKSEKK
jgi:hypothetical protein